MLATESLPETLIRDSLARAVGRVFATSLSLPVRLRIPDPLGGFAPARPDAAPFSGAQVVGSVGFFGEIEGVMYLCFDQAFAQLCTGNMLGLDAAEALEMGEEAVNDAIGEITNMVVGAFKNGLCHAGFPCKLGLPTVLRGANVSIGPTTWVRRHFYGFESAGHSVAADVLIKAGD